MTLNAYAPAPVSSGAAPAGICRRYFIALLILTAVFTFTGCGNKADSKPVTESSFQLGTLVELTLYSGPGRQVFKKAFELISAYENTLSRNIESSEVSEINRNAGISPVVVSSDTFFVIEKGLYYSSLTGGLFDISIGPLVSLWGIGSEDARLPTPDEIASALALVDHSKVRLTAGENSVFLEKEKMAIDLGAAAKGFIADKVLELLTENSVKSAIINLGGNVVLLGRKPDGRLFRIGIQNPFDTRGSYLGILEGENVSIVTSGIYERYFEEGGKRYHHILNPDTGYPVENDIMGISVITEKSVEGDCLSTSLFMLGSEKALQLVESLENTEALIITKDKKIYLSSGIGNRFTLTDSQFSIF